MNKIIKTGFMKLIPAGRFLKSSRGTESKN
jgi:hypothetical protein